MSSPPRTRSAASDYGLRQRKETIMSLRPVKQIIQTKPTIEGAGVKLQRAFGFGKTKDFDPFPAAGRFSQRQPAGLPGGISRGIRTAGSRRSLTCSPAPWSTATAWATRANDRRRRAMDDRRQRHPAPGNAQGRRAGTHARLSAVGQPALIAEDDRSALSGHSGERDPRGHRR